MEHKTLVDEILRFLVCDKNYLLTGYKMVLDVGNSFLTETRTKLIAKYDLANAFSLQSDNLHHGYLDYFVMILTNGVSQLYYMVYPCEFEKLMSFARLWDTKCSLSDKRRESALSAAFKQIGDIIEIYMCDTILRIIEPGQISEEAYKKIIMRLENEIISAKAFNYSIDLIHSVDAAIRRMNLALKSAHYDQRAIERCSAHNSTVDVFGSRVPIFVTTYDINKDLSSAKTGTTRDVFKLLADQSRIHKLKMLDMYIDSYKKIDNMSRLGLPQTTFSSEPSSVVGELRDPRPFLPDDYIRTLDVA